MGKSKSQSQLDRHSRVDVCVQLVHVQLYVGVITYNNFAVKYGKLRWMGTLQYNTPIYMGYHHTNVGCEEGPPVTCVIAVTETVFLSIIF